MSVNMMSQSNCTTSPHTAVLGSPYANYFFSFPLISGSDHQPASPLLSVSLPPAPYSCSSCSSPVQTPAALLSPRRSSALFNLTYIAHDPVYYTNTAAVSTTPETNKANFVDFSPTSASSIAAPSTSISHPSPVTSSSSPPPPVSTSTSFTSAAHVPSGRSKRLDEEAVLARPVGESLGASGEWMSHKSRRQRKSDTQRRQRESVGFHRLYTLLAAYNAKKQQRLSDTQQQKQQRQVDEEEDRRPSKAEILHQCAERIEQLERTLNEWTSAHLRRGSVQSSMFLFAHRSACIVVIHVPSGYISDANERYLNHINSERSWTVGRRFFPPSQQVRMDLLSLTRPCHAAFSQTNRVLCKPANGQLQETQQKLQSEKTMRLLHQLYKGETDTIYATWRGQFGDGRTWEMGAHSWITEWEQHEDGTRSPMFLLGQVNTSETVCVD